MTTEEAWNAYSEELLRYFEAQTKDPQLAGDLRQEVFVKLHEHLGELRNTAKVEHWLRAVARNVLIDHWKASGRTFPSAVWEGSADDERFAQFADTCVRTSIKSLPRPYGQAVQLADIEGMKQSEVAHKLGISVSGAKSRIQRGRRMLRDIIQDCCHVELNARNELVDARCLDEGCEHEC